MKRRDFIAHGAAWTAGAGLSGCSVFGPRKVKVHYLKELAPIEMDKKVPKPQGTMQMGEIGKTGIKVSRYGFGSHIKEHFQPYKKEREWMIMEAYNLGVNSFDVYDREHLAYQYEPMGRYLAPVINNVVISIAILPYDGRTFEQEFERDLRLFGRDYIDLVRIHCYSNDSEDWWQWEELFKYKKQGKIRAVGVPIHNIKDLYPLIDTYPIDYVIFPYNFYHNYTWHTATKEEGDYDLVVPELRKRGIGLITMKPFGSDQLVTPFKRMAAQYDESGEVVYAMACLRYIINSGVDIDSTLGGMMNPYHVCEAIGAYFNPEMSYVERNTLKKIRDVAKIVASGILPEYYRFLEDWVPDSFDDSDLFSTA